MSKALVDFNQPQELMVLSQSGDTLFVQHLVPSLPALSYGTASLYSSLRKSPDNFYSVRLGDKDKKLEPGSIIKVRYRESLSQALKNLA